MKITLLQRFPHDLAAHCYARLLLDYRELKRELRKPPFNKREMTKQLEKSLQKRKESTNKKGSCNFFVISVGARHDALTASTAPAKSGADLVN